MFKIIIVESHIDNIIYNTNCVVQYTAKHNLIRNLIYNLIC